MFDAGPSTGDWSSGFTPSEERGRLTLRWSRSSAAVRLPLVAPAGEGRLLIRGGRMLDQPTRLRLFVGDQPVASADVAPSGMRRLLAFDFTHRAGPLDVDLVADDPELGLAVDWIRIEGLRPRLGAAAWAVRLVAPGLLLLGLAAGLGLARAAAIAAAAALGEAAWAAHDPFALAHVASRVAIPGLLFGLLAVLALRRVAGGGAVALLACAAFLVKGAALFHPSYFYDDVRQNHRYVRALASAEGERLQDRNHAAQVAVGVGYPRVVAGQRYAFPYSPVFYLPFTGLQRPEAIVDAIKLVALVAAAGEALAVFGLARLLGVAPLALPAALVSVFLRPLFNRMLFAMWSTLAGHLLDLLLILAVAALAAHPRSWRRLAAAGLALLAALLSYVSSLFNASAFVGFASLLLPRLGRRLLPLWALVTGGVLAWLYGDFVLLFFRELLPAALAAPGAAAGEAPGGALDALRRIPLFYGWLAPLLAAAGGVILLRRLQPAARRVLLAYGLSVALLLGLRGFGGGLFKDLKELELAAPLVALAVAAALDRLRAQSRSGAWLAGAAGLWVAGFGVWRGLQDLAGHTRVLGLP